MPKSPEGTVTDKIGQDSYYQNNPLSFMLLYGNHHLKKGNLMSEIAVDHQQGMGIAPIVTHAITHTAGRESPPHYHPTAQLLYAVRGVMLVKTEQGQWIVPPTRAIWVPIGTRHQVRMLGEVHMRSVYIRQELLSDFPDRCEVVAISPLLRELILESINLPKNYDETSRGGHLIRLLLDEIKCMPSLPLALPEPSSPRLQGLCHALRQQPDDNKMLKEWAKALAMDVRTLQRRFTKETGMSVGQWRRQNRLLLACEHLARGESVLEVSLALGYASSSAFSAMFKRELGIAPSLFYG